MIPKSEPKTWSMAGVTLMKNQYKECDVSLVCQNEKYIVNYFPNGNKLHEFFF